MNMRRPGYRTVDTQVAALAARVPEGTIRRWASEGRIERAGRDDRGRTLYDLDDVLRQGTVRSQTTTLSDST